MRPGEAMVCGVALCMEGKAMPGLSHSSSILLARSLGEWFVCVTKEGRSTVHTFDRQPFARAFAEEQRVRLGLDHIEAVDENES